MTVWDGLLLCIVGYVAVVALVRLMIARRNQLLTQLREEKGRQHRSQRQQPPTDSEKAA